MDVVALKEAYTGPTTGANITNAGDGCRPRHGGPGLRQPAFDWTAPDKYVYLSDFEMEVMNILKTKGYELNEEGKVPMI